MKIGEMASATATNIETVRYYEKIGLLPAPARNAANYRSYGNEHLARLSFIRRARATLASRWIRCVNCSASPTTGRSLVQPSMPSRPRI